MKYFQNLTIEEIEKRDEAVKEVARNRKKICDGVIQKFNDKKQLKKDDSRKPVAKKRK